MVNYPSNNLAELGRFLTRSTSVLHFLVLTTFFAVLVVVFDQASGLLHCTENLSNMNGQLQVALATAAGVLLLFVSRRILLIVSKHHNISDMGYLIWLLAELIAIIAIMSLVLWIVSGGGKLALAALAADLVLYLFAIEALPYVISLLAFRLHEEHAEVERLQSHLDELRLSNETEGGFATERPVSFYDKGNKLVFSTARANVLYIEAADNYANIHYMNEGHEDTFILHNTLKELERQLANSGIVRCHRGYMVNIDNVKLLRKEGISLLIELSGGGKTIPVTKTYAASITARLAPDIV